MAHRARRVEALHLPAGQLAHRLVALVGTAMVGRDVELVERVAERARAPPVGVFELLAVRTQRAVGLRVDAVAGDDIARERNRYDRRRREQRERQRNSRAQAHVTRNVYPTPRTV